MKKYSYFAILQQQPDSVKSGTAPFDDYKSSIPANIQKVAAEFQKIKTETIQKNGTILRGGLTHFLSTPLQSDKDEIIKLIRDSIENTVQQLDAAPMLSSVQHALCWVMEPQEVPLQRQIVGVMKRLLKNGRTLLLNAGCQFGKSSGPVAVSLFTFDGFSTIQSVNSIIHTAAASNNMTVVNGAIDSTLTFIEKEPSQDPHVVVVDFDTAEESITDIINAKLPILLDQFGIKSFTLSKQTLHNSFGSAYQIRFSMNVNKHPLGSVILSLTGENDELEDAITNHGSLIVLEQMP